MFTDKDDQSDKVTETPSTVSLDDQLKLIVNSEGKQKYESVDKAIAALKASQEFIPQLENDNKTLKEKLAELEAELSKRSSVEDVISKLLPKEDKEKAEPVKGTPPDNGINEKSVEELLSSLLNKREAETSRKSNQETVEKAFIEKFGDSAKTKFSELAKESNLSIAELQELSAKSPSVVLRLLPELKQAPKTTSGGFNTSALFSRPQQEQPLQDPNKSLLAGANSKEVRTAWRAHVEAVHKKLNVES